MTFYMRKRFGLRWPTAHPPIPWRQIAIVVACSLTWAVAERYGSLHEKVVSMEQDLPVFESYRQVVLDAANGDARFMLADGSAFECRGGKL